VVAASGDIASPFGLVNELAKSLRAEVLEIKGSRHTTIGSDLAVTQRVIQYLLD